MSFVLVWVVGVNEDIVEIYNHCNVYEMLESLVDI